MRQQAGERISEYDSAIAIRALESCLESSPYRTPQLVALQDHRVHPNRFPLQRLSIRPLDGSLAPLEVAVRALPGPRPYSGIDEGGGRDALRHQCCRC